MEYTLDFGDLQEHLGEYYFNEPLNKTLIMDITSEYFIFKNYIGELLDIVNDDTNTHSLTNLLMSSFISLSIPIRYESDDIAHNIHTLWSDITELYLIHSNAYTDIKDNVIKYFKRYHTEIMKTRSMILNKVSNALPDIKLDDYEEPVVAPVFFKINNPIRTKKVSLELRYHD